MRLRDNEFAGKVTKRALNMRHIIPFALKFGRKSVLNSVMAELIIEYKRE